MYSYSVLVVFTLDSVVSMLLNDTICVQQELQDRNDELSSELEVLKNQGSGRKTRQTRDRFSVHSWSGRKALTTESDSGKFYIKSAFLIFETNLILTALDSRH